MKLKSSDIVRGMCNKELAAADIKAICKARGFSLSHAGTPSLLENFILSDIGLEAAFAGLDRKEIIMLNLLKCMKKPVDVSLFQPLIGKENRWDRTFNQKYGDAFKHVKTRLIRKGVLIFAADPSQAHKKTRLERLVFDFPTEFHSSLPAPFKSAAVFSAQGEFNDALIRKKLGSILSSDSKEGTREFPLDLNQGVLEMGGGEFSLETFRTWQLRKWAMCVKPSLYYCADPAKNISPMAALKYTFSLPGPDQWIEPDELKMILKIFRTKGSALKVNEICSNGWKHGCLIRLKNKGKTWYRWAHAHLETPDDPVFGDYFRADAGGNLEVDLETIPLKSLEILSRIALFQVKAGRLIASPDVIRIGRNLADIRDDPLIAWLEQNFRSFADAFKTVAEKWGKCLVHRNLLIAKVGNIGLKVSLEKTFKDGKVLFLPGGFIAFPEKLLARVEALVAKNGFAVKTIGHSSEKARQA